MSTTSVASGQWTFDDLAEAKLPLDLSCYEVVDGHLVVRDELTLPHGTLAFELASRLNEELPTGWRARNEVGVALGRNGRRADLAVVRHGAAVRRRQMGQNPADVALLCEVVSPSSTATDRVTKPREYAAAGVASYWRIELEPEPLLVVHRLVDGAYVEVHRVDERGEVLLPLGEGSVTLSIDLAALLPALLD